MTVGFRQPLSAATESDVQRLASRIGHALPDEYRDYCLTVGGGYLAANTGAVKVVFGLRDDAPEWARINDKLDTFTGRVPPWLLPVAQDEYGNLYAVSLRDGDNGSVWFWDHEEEADEGDAPVEDNIVRKADGWSQFVAGLQPA